MLNSGYYAQMIEDVDINIKLILRQIEFRCVIRNQWCFLSADP